MAVKQGLDVHANKAYGTVTMSAANTLTFGQINTNVNIMEKVAWIIHRIDWFLTTTQLLTLDDDGDSFSFVLSSSNQMADLQVNNPALIDQVTIVRQVMTAVGFTGMEVPISRDFSSMPGGGLIVAPRPLYIGMDTVGLVGAASVEALIYFTAKEITPQDYYDLLDSYRVVQ